MKHMALFAGIGGFMKAAEELGYENAWANEIVPRCCQTLRNNFKNTEIIEKSISTISDVDLKSVTEGVDLLTAGFPCQSFSQAGSFKAFEDDRGKLFFDIPRIILLMKEPPKIVLLENVAHLKLFDNGSLLKVVLNEMRFAGYWVSEKNAQILNSAEFGGTPQRRERLFIVCAHKKYFDNNNFDFKSLKKMISPRLFDIIDRSVYAGDSYYLSNESKYFKMIDELAAAEGKERLYQIRRVVARACPPGYCPTLTANMGDGGHNVPFVFDNFGLRRLTEDECMEMQGFKSEEWQFPDGVLAKDILRMTGNAVNVTVVKNIMKQIAFQFFSREEAKGNDKQTTMAIPTQQRGHRPRL